jgi:hypothetical protein
MGYRPTDLISPGYLEEQQVLHAAPRGYGGRGEKWAGIVLQVAYAYQCHSVLDYGCGQGTLAAMLRTLVRPDIYRVDEYDPAIAGKDAPPLFADLVSCTDVLEHIEPDRLDAVLGHLRTLARKAVFVVISLKPTNKRLRDGRNAHLIIRPAAWWKDRLRVAGFTLAPPPSAARVNPKEWTGVLLP